MDTQHLLQCDRLTENYKKIRAREKWNDSQISLAAACLFTAYGRAADPERIRACRKIIRKKKGIFSDFRGVVEYVVAAKLAMQEDAEAYFERMTAIYRELNPGLFGDERVIVASMILADHACEGNIGELAGRTRDIYNQMKRDHRMLTSKEDMPYAALMACPKMDTETVCTKAERAYRVLLDELKADRNTKQSISHIISLADIQPEDAAANVSALAKKLREKRRSLGRGTQAVILGTLAGTPGDPDAVAEAIAEADARLKREKPFKGMFGLSARDRRMYAAICVQSAMTDQEKAQDAAMIGASLTVTIVLNLILMIVVVCQ